jgi:hypothetical protein
MSDYDDGYRAGQGLSNELPSGSAGWAGYGYGMAERHHNLAAGSRNDGGSGSLGVAAGAAMKPAVVMLVILYFVVLGAVAAAISALLGGSLLR